jgi:hypothetical protein
MDLDLKALRTPQEEENGTVLPPMDISREVAAGWIGGGSAGQFFTHSSTPTNCPTSRISSKTR